MDVPRSLYRIAVVAFLTAGLCFAAEPAQPTAIDPGAAGQAPSDAVVLFDGNELSAWVHADGSPAKWAVEDGEIVGKTGSGNIQTMDTFSSFQLHIEFATPHQPEVKSQARGNSGVYLQGRYELQVLDSYNNPTYPDGSAGAIYRQAAPLVNASRPPTQWQTYDVIFRAPKCFGNNVIGPATVTVLQNGVVVQDHFEMQGPTPGTIDNNICEPGPILLQDHIHRDVEETALRFRNIWARRLNSR